MKTGMILGLLASSFIVTSVSAAEMSDTMMMKKDTMMSDTMMMKDTMSMSKMSVTALAKNHGYTWSKDRKMLAQKAGVTNYRGTVKQNLMIRKYLMSMKKDMMADSSMMKKEIPMMKDDTMMKKDDYMMKKESGMYTPYSESAVTAALASGKSVYLFFHATWCPGCRALDTAILGALGDIPAGSIIYKVDYDTETALRTKHGVTMQHTVVKLNADGTTMKKIVAPTKVMDIVK
jgi:thiol-disulfide isomerase/thioredoxin